MARPTKFKSEYCQEIIKYFDMEPHRDVDIPHMGPTGEFKWMDFKRVSNPLPTFLGFAKKIGVNGDTLVEWAKEENKKKYPGFSASYIRAKELQKWFLIENGLNGLYNPQFAIFVAKNITDMKDKTSTDITSDGKQIVGFNYIEPDGKPSTSNKA